VEGRNGIVRLTGSVNLTGGGKLRCGIYHIAYFTSKDGEMPILYLAMPKIESVQTK
jgi:hypothetical protein